MKKAVYTLVASLSALIPSHAQMVESPLLFDVYEWDFGKIDEKEGVVTHTFNFTNISGKPVTINGVNTSCGCTTTQHSTQTLAPGSQNTFTVSFNPAGTEGELFREVEVLTLDFKAMDRLVVKATVNPEPLGVTQLFPQQVIGEVRVRTMRCNFGYIAQGFSKTESLNMVNNTSEPVRIGLEGLEEGGKLTADFPHILPPHSADAINLTYSIPVSDSDYGTLRDSLYLTVNGERASEPFVITAVQTDNFNPLPTATPFIRIQPALVELGVKSAGKVHSATLELENTGKADLIIRHVECGGGASVSIKRGLTLKPGQRRKVTLSVKNASTPKTETTGWVILTTNDPNRPIKELRIVVSTK